MRMYLVFIKKLRPLFLYLTYEFVQIFITFSRTDVKYGKTIVLILLHTLYKALRMSELSFSNSFVSIFLFSFAINATNFVIHSSCRFVLKKTTHAFPVSSLKYIFCSLYMQMYILNACKLDWDESLFDFCVESLAFRIKILLNIT